MNTHRIAVIILLGIMLTSIVALPFVSFSSELRDDARDTEIMQDSAQNGFERAAGLHDYLMQSYEDGYWLDAKANGENLGLSGFTDYTTYFLQFNFSFYDDEFDMVYISNCGYLSFIDSTPDDVNSPSFPSTSTAHELTIAPYWDFLPASNNIYAWNTSEYLVVQYDHVYIMEGPEVGTFQVVLYANGTIDFNYLEILYNEDPTVGLNYGDGVYYNLFPSADLDGVTNFTIRFNYYHDYAELEVMLDGPVYTEIDSTYQYNATVTNFGLITATDLDLTFYLDDVMVNTTVISSLASSENFTWAYKFYAAEEGLIDMRVSVEQVPDEFTYDNNEDTMTIIVSVERNYAIFQDDWPWSTTATADLLDEHGIAYDIYSSLSMGIVDLSSYTRVIISSDQPMVFRQRLYGNLTWFEDFAASGGVLEVFAADQYGEEWVNGDLPGAPSYVQAEVEEVDIVTPWHQVLNIPESYSDDVLDYWDSSAHGYLENVTTGSLVILETPEGQPVLVEFPFGEGHIIITTQTVEYAYESENVHFLENLLLYRFTAESEILVGLDAPSYSLPGQEISLDLYVSNWGSQTENDVEVTVHANDELLYSHTIAALSNGTTFTVEIQWTPVFPGSYEVTAYVAPLAGETIVVNNEDTKVVLIRSEVGRILFWEGHGCDTASYYDILIDDLEKSGYIVDAISDPINASLLDSYSAFMCSEPQENFWANETAALQAYVMGGGGIFIIGDSYQAPLNNLTLFAGIEWLDVPDELYGPTTNITLHAITEGISELYFDSPVSYFNLTGTATNLVYLDGFEMLAVCEVGDGRVVGLADDNCLDDSWGLSDAPENVLLGINIINWITEGRQYNEITNVQQDPLEVTHEDVVNISCMVTDIEGVDSVSLRYRVDGGGWMSIGMSPTLEDTYEAIIPAQAAGALVEYYISATNSLNITTIDDNDGELYQYIVAIPTPTTTTTIVTTTVTTSTVTTTVSTTTTNVTVTTTTTTSTPTTASTSTSTTEPTTTTNGTLPDNTMVMIIIIVGAGGAVLVIVIVIVIKKRS